MKPTIIKINGENVRCRALSDSQVIQEGDVFADGSGSWTVSEYRGKTQGYLKMDTRPTSQLYRPIEPAKKPAAKAPKGVKTVHCYGILKNGILQPEAFPCFAGKKWMLGGSEKCVPVTITLRRKAGK